MDKKEIRKKAKNLQPAVRMGKSGLTTGVLEEIKNQLKLHNLIKVKLLKSLVDSIDKKAFISEIADSTNSELILSVGNTFVLWNRKNYK
jgi:RNA-binding protein